MSTQNENKKPSNAKSKLTRPGPLVTNDGSIQYHTHQVIKLVQGRSPRAGQHPVMGLLAFASKLTPIHDAAKSDDPYADHFLVLIEQRLGRIREFLQREESELEAMAMAVSSSIKLIPAHSSEPSTFSARFKSPYAFGAAYLMQDLDNYVSHCFALNQRMVITNRDRFTRIDKAVGMFRSLFTLVRDYKVFGLTRSDFKLQTAVVKSATSYFESLPRPITLTEALLNREERAEFAPDINPLLISESKAEGSLESSEI